MASSAILCTNCGAASAAPLLQCAKCGGKNARVCAGCGFHNSLAKNYCDKCGNPIADHAASVAPPPPTAVPDAPKSEIPVTAVKHGLKGPLGKDASPSPAVPPPVALPPAKLMAVEPGAAMDAITFPLRDGRIPKGSRHPPSPTTPGPPWRRCGQMPSRNGCAGS